MMKLFFAVCLLGISTVTALHCWECENAWGNDDCLKKGHLQQCLPNQQSCQTEIRHGNWNSRILIRKGCKQSHACYNNYIQNPRGAWVPSQCNEKDPSSVCRCCCDTDSCNMDLTSCTDKTPRCFPPHVRPANGDVTCSNSNKVESVCSFKCDAGYDLVGEISLVCQDNQQWDNSAPVCRPAVCRPAHVAPSNGRVSCSDENRVNSRCIFACDNGFALQGNSVSRCDDNGIWSHQAPTCKEILCLPGLNSPVNGEVTCTDDVRVGSVCSFECDDGFDLEGNVRSTCLDGSEIRCVPPQAVPEHGDVICSRDNLVGSVCDFTCDEGYALVGFSETTCVDSGSEGAFGTWTNPTPTCAEITCLPRHVAPRNGAVFCSKSNLLGSVCEFSCDSDYFMLGSPISMCGESPSGGVLGEWSDRAPICQRKSCPPGPGSPLNGRSLCSDGNFIGSECEFICNDYHRLEGAFTSKCIELEDGSINWTNPPPACLPNLCEHQDALPHGEIVCSKDNYATSKCDFRCITPEYNLYPPESTSNFCQNNTHWNIPMPCCARPCPPYAVMDFIVILDSSSSVGSSNWNKMKNFVRNFLDDFSVAPDASHYGIFRYNAKVDTDTQILLGDYPNNIDALLNAFDEIPYDGSGTRTGNAINHAVDVMLKEENGNRAGARDVVLILTDGNSQDDVIIPSQRLQETGAIVFVLPIKPPQRNPNKAVTLDLDEIRAMAGSEERVITAAIEGGFDALTDDFSVEVSNMICGNPCDHVLHTH